MLEFLQKTFQALNTKYPNKNITMEMDSSGNAEFYTYEVRGYKRVDYEKVLTINSWDDWEYEISSQNPD